MTAVAGKYVRMFTEATHALPEGMHMNADYPFKLPEIVKIEGNTVTIRGRNGQEATAKIKRMRDLGQEFFVLSQSSAFETLFKRKPTKFKFLPFRDEEAAKRKAATAP